MIRKLVSEIQQKLEPNQQHEAIQIVQHAIRVVTGKRAQSAEIWMNESFSEFAEIERCAQEVLKERILGKSLQYIFGYAQFLDHEYDLIPNVLIPRPETEVLVEEMRARLSNKKEKPALGVEIGVGSGILSIELMDAFADLQMISTDVSSDCLALAKKNAEKILGSSERFTLLQAQDSQDVFTEVKKTLADQRSDFLVSNPPYGTREDEVTEEVLANEPHLAIFPENGNPLYFYEVFAREAREILRPEGEVFLEIPHERSSEIKTLFDQARWRVEVLPDLTGRDRVLVASLGN